MRIHYAVFYRDSFSNTLVFFFARNESPLEVPNPNLLGKAVDELKNEKQEG